MRELRRASGVSAGLGFVVLLLTCAVPGIAAAPERVRYEGETSQERRVLVITNRRGAAIKAGISWRGRCEGPYTIPRSWTRFRSPLDRSGPNGFRDRRVYRSGGGRFTARYTARITGERTRAGRLEGSFRVKAVFREDGRRYTTCRAEKITWKAKRVLG